MIAAAFGKPYAKVKMPQQVVYATAVRILSPRRETANYGSPLVTASESGN